MTVLGEKSNFQGQRGGDAHDAELLALLRGVSAKSGAADRFAGGDDTNDDGCIGIIETPDESQQQQPSDDDKSKNIDAVQDTTSTSIVNNLSLIHISEPTRPC